MAAQDGDTVRVHYTGTLPDGEEFDSSRGSDPLEFTIGEERVIPGFEDMVQGLEPGETATETLGPEKAYGQRDEERVLEVNRARLPDDVEVGEQLEIQHPDGARARVAVTELGEETAELDGNHPLAGRELTFEIELVDIVDE